MKIPELLEPDLSCATSSSLIHTPWLDARIRWTSIRSMEEMVHVADPISWIKTLLFLLLLLLSYWCCLSLICPSLLGLAILEYACSCVFVLFLCPC